jgi:hypothetical protein
MKDPILCVISIPMHIGRELKIDDSQIFSNSLRFLIPKKVGMRNDTF